jgi:hypothetical protein
MSWVQLKNPSILHYDSFVNNEWIPAKKGGRFEVIGESPSFSI